MAAAIRVPAATTRCRGLRMIGPPRSKHSSCRACITSVCLSAGRPGKCEAGGGGGGHSQSWEGTFAYILVGGSTCVISNREQRRYGKGAPQTRSAVFFLVNARSRHSCQTVQAPVDHPQTKECRPSHRSPPLKKRILG